MKTAFGLSSIAFAMAAASGRAQTTTCVSATPGGATGNGDSWGPSVSFDGRFVAFVSRASNLVVGDTNPNPDVFVRDRATGTTTLVSVDSAGVQAALAGSFDPSISADGRFVALSSDAANLVPADTNGSIDVFVHDREAGATSLVSVDSAGGQGDAGSGRPSISRDGRFVAFHSNATNLVADDTNGREDVFVHDRLTGLTVRASVDTAGIQGDGESSAPVISEDGRFVAFQSAARNLVPGDTNINVDVFLRDLAAGTTSLVSVDSAGLQGDGGSGWTSISADGRFVAFQSTSRNLDASDADGDFDVFIHDGLTGLTMLASVNSAGLPGDDESMDPSISADGGVVAFWGPSHLVPDAVHGFDNVFVHYRGDGATTIASVDAGGVPGNSGSYANAISGDGRVVAFASLASNFVAGDTTTYQDIFVRELRDPSACLAGTVNSGVGASANVLLVNGSAGDAHRVVDVATHAAFQLSLDTSPSGPGGPGNPVAHYVLWVWPGFPSNSYDFVARNATLGCTAGPTPFKPHASPQAFRCIRGTGIPASACRPGTEVPAPARAPWTTTRNQGIPSPAVFTIQGMLQDTGAANATGYSVTNAVVLRIQ